METLLEINQTCGWDGQQLRIGKVNWQKVKIQDFTNTKIKLKDVIDLMKKVWLEERKTILVRKTNSIESRILKIEEQEVKIGMMKITWEIKLKIKTKINKSLLVMKTKIKMMNLSKYNKRIKKSQVP